MKKIAAYLAAFIILNIAAYGVGWTVGAIVQYGAQQ